MQETKKKKKNGGNDDSKKKERHIVTWTPEEDDTLREQIRLHGTENWAIIASKFKGKSTRQCRRRWYTYLNSDFKRGGWSPEEDMLLCEAQRVFGNRWTEIAKVVSGRTDNAVKNRFTTLCKKRAKCEAIAIEIKNGCFNSNNKRMLFPHIAMEAPLAKKFRRCHILDHGAAQNAVDAAAPQAKGGDDDPKEMMMMQQAEILSSYAHKVNADITDQSMANAWKILTDFLNKSKEKEIPDIELQLEEFKELLEDVRRQCDGHESPASSEYSTGSTVMQGGLSETQTTHKQDEEVVCDENAAVDMLCNDEYSSPLEVTPLFRSLAAGIPSPQFSESERTFLLKTLGIDSPSPCPINGNNPSSQPPLCKRVLLDSL